MCVLLGVFPEFLVDPYYEPLAWFMIYLYLSIYVTGFAIRGLIRAIINI